MKKGVVQILRLFFFPLLVTLLLLSAYSNTIHSPLVLDDYHSFVEEPRVYVNDWNLDSLKRLAGTKFGLARYLPMLSFSLDQWRGSGRISAFHVTNMFIHIAAAWALFFMVLTLLRAAADTGVSGNIPGRGKGAVCLAGLVVCLWALHPVETNAVTYVVQRMTAMAGLFYLLAFACYLKARLLYREHRCWPAAACLAAAVLAALAAFASKQNTATLPLAVIGTEMLFFRPTGANRWIRRHRVLTAILAACLVALGIVVAGNALPHLLEGYDIRHFTLGERLLTQLRVVSVYVGILLLPLPGRLNLEHDVPLSTSLLRPPTTLAALCFLLLLGIWAWRMRRQNPLVTFGIGWFFLNLVIESSIIPLELMFEHRLYLPAAGFYIALAAACYRPLQQLGKRLLHGETAEKGHRLAAASIMLAAALLCLATYQRNKIWADAVVLHEDCVAKAPGKPRNHSNLSKSYILAGRYDDALRAAERAIELGVHGYEEYWVSAANLLSALGYQGRLREEVKRGEELLRAAPEDAKLNAYPLFLVNLGTACYQQKNYPRAEELFAEALEILSSRESLYVQSVAAKLAATFKRLDPEGAGADPAFGDGRLAEFFYGLRHYDLARRYVESGLKRNPACKVCQQVRKSLADIELANRVQRQKGTLRSSYLFHPFADRFHFYMAVAYALEKYHLPFDSLIHSLLARARHERPDSVDAMMLASWYYYKNQQPERALELIDEALAREPDHAQLWVNRGMYCMALKDGAGAEMAFQHALELYPDYPKRKQVFQMLTAVRRLRGGGENEPT